MIATDVLKMLAAIETKLSDALRSALLLPEVRNDAELLSWVEAEVSGYSDPDVPAYRRRDLTSMGDASNGAWLHQGAVIPIRTFSQKIQDYADATTSLVQSIGTLEALLASDSKSFKIPWQDNAVRKLNYEIHEGGTGVDSTYQFTQVRWDVPRPTVQEIVDSSATELSQRSRSA